MIEGKSLELIYSDGTVGLYPVDFTIQKGELVYIVGPSGSGKTSLMKLIIGSEYPTGGELITLGEKISRQNSKNIRKMRHKIGPVFQEFRLIKGKTTLENVVLGMRFLGLSKVYMYDEAKKALEKVGLSHKIGTKVDFLSWGECQRVAIARAVVRKPSLILADEPTGNLDKDNAINMLELLASFRDAETAVVMTTHATHLIEERKDATFIYMDRGNVRIERGGRK